MASLLANYAAAMVTGNVDACIRIERENDLFGYPPEVVSVALRAIDEGRDPEQAVDAYLSGEHPNVD